MAGRHPFSRLRDGLSPATRRRFAHKRLVTFDPAVYLRSVEDFAAYLDAALEDGDPRVVAAALGDIARAKGMGRVARKAGLTRQSLNKALSPDGNPEFATVLKVVRGLKLRLHVRPAAAK